MMFLFLVIFIVTMYMGMNTMEAKKECDYHSWVYKENTGLECSVCGKIVTDS